MACRACRGEAGDVVLDLGEQPACDYFPPRETAGPDPVYPLQMWLCAGCGLAQLLADPTVPEEPRSTEPAALVAQAAAAVEEVAAAGMLGARRTVIEYGSPHGGSWLGLLAARGLTSPGDDREADLVLDCFGLMHATDQFGALADRVRHLVPGGVLLLQYHSFETIVRRGQWNALRHGHYAYYSTTALTAMLRAQSFAAQTAWTFDLYGGTVLLAACRDSDAPADPDEPLQCLLAEEDRMGIRDPAVVGSLQRVAEGHAAALHDWLAAERSAGRRVLGYGAASRAIALLVRAGVDSSLLPAIVDASPAKQGTRIPGTDVPVVDPSYLRTVRPDSVVLFLADLLGEVRAAFPEVEAGGGRWIDADTLVSRR